MDPNWLGYCASDYTKSTKLKNRCDEQDILLEKDW